MNNPKKTNEFLYFALKNKKVLLGLSIILIFLVLGFVGPIINHNKPLDYVDPSGAHPPSAKYWFGTTFFGQDVFSQFVHGLQATFLVGIARRRNWHTNRDTGRFRSWLSRRYSG